MSFSMPALILASTTRLPRRKSTREYQSGSDLRFGASAHPCGKSIKPAVVKGTRSKPPETLTTRGSPLDRISKAPQRIFVLILILGAIAELWLGALGFAAQEWPF